MSNFTIFEKHYLKLLLEPFSPGMADHIIPIRYDAITPDLFALLFKTNGKDGKEYYFVALEFDHIDGLAGAQCAIEDWHGSFIEFLPVVKPKSTNQDDTFRHTSHAPYFAMLARVERPKGLGYWSDNIVIAPGDSIGQKIAHLSAEQQQAVRKGLQDILKHSIGNPSVSFAESFAKAHTATVVEDRNATDMIVSIYMKKDNSFEMFYNRVAQ